MNRLITIACAVALLANAAPAQSNATSVPTTRGLSEELSAKDRQLFDAIFTTCDSIALKGLITDDFEFYHDRWGQIAKSAAEFVANINGICDRQRKGTDYRARRELLSESVRVYPMANYGGIHMGEHRFFKLTPGKPDELTETAKFMSLWKKQNGEWRLARVLSYDHRDPGGAALSQPTASSIPTSGRTVPRSVNFASPKRIAGISTRTTNARERDPATAALGALWGRFAQSETRRGPGARKPVYSVYSEYESDLHGAYTVVIGREDDLPAPGEKVVTVPAGRYLEFTSTGEMPAAVIAGWQQVWEFFAAPGAPKRSYTSDFEYYDPATPSTVRIYVAVR
ncbi:MAG: effector binding domain-containing protein [Gemmatimonadaceae bacterium]